MKGLPPSTPAWPGRRGPQRSPLLAQDLVLLGVLMDGPKHGYDIRQHIQTRLGELATISGGTIYYTLRKLEGRGCVTMTRDREGNRPERMVYEITDAGRAEFRKLMRQAFFEEATPYVTFDAGLYFAPHADLEEMLEGARHQIARLQAFEEHIAALEKAHPVRWPFNLEALKDHTRAVASAHRGFYEELAKDLGSRIERARSRKRPTTNPSSRPPDKASEDSLRAGRGSPEAIARSVAAVGPPARKRRLANG